MSQPESAAMPPTDEPGPSPTSHVELTSPEPPTQPLVKSYSPPKADALTFPTQEAFLESLEPISIEEVNDNNRRCPICWKAYGEKPDPGFDNTEMPVKLRCGHIFGDKCLASTFGLPETVRHSLKPLSFDGASAGCLLGSKLEAWLRTSAAVPEQHVQKLEDMLLAADGDKLFGEYWWIILQGMIALLQQL